VPLFIDRLPLQYREVVSAGRRMLGWYALLPAILTEPEFAGPPAGASPRLWKFDSGCALDAAAWRFHLQGAGLDPTAPDKLDDERAKIRGANDALEELPIRHAGLWLVSNIPALQQAPYRLGLSPGLPYYDRPPRRPAGLYPLLGMRAFRRARLEVKIDFDGGTLSVWTPGPRYRAVSQYLRRLPGRFATVPLDQLCAEW
jgi:hypothetical protein